VGWIGALISAVWTVLALGLGRGFQQRGAAPAASPARVREVAGRD
jgi:hypothetical protein